MFQLTTLNKCWLGRIPYSVLSPSTVGSVSTLNDPPTGANSAGGPPRPPSEGPSPGAPTSGAVGCVASTEAAGRAGCVGAVAGGGNVVAGCE